MLPFLFSAFIFEKGILIVKIFPGAIKIKDEDDFWFFLWEYSANTGKRRIILSPCQRTCHLFLCFTLLLGHSLMCSDTSALTLQLTVTQFLYHTEQRRGSSVISQCSEESESWLSANCMQIRAEVISSSYFPAFTCDKGF